MNEWFSELEQRERIVLVGAAVITALLVLFVFVLRPLNQRTELLAQEVAAKQSLRIDLARVAGVRGNAPRGPAATDSSLYGLAQRIADQHALPLGLIRQDGGDNALRITFNDVPFDALAAWLGTLSNEHSIRVEQLNAHGRETGIVSGQVTLRRS